MLSGKRITSISCAISSALQKLDDTAFAASAWGQLEEFFPPFREQPRLQKSFLKIFPEVNKTPVYWQSQVRRVEADIAERKRPRNVKITAACRRNDRYVEAKRVQGKRARFPDFDPFREQRAKRYRAERQLEAAIDEVSSRPGWVVLAITITMPGNRRSECKDYYDAKLSNIRKRLEKYGPVSEQIALFLITELTGADDDLLPVGNGVEHPHGIIGCPVENMAEILHQFRREFGEIGFACSMGQPREKFTPVRLSPIFDARGWVIYCCKRVGAAPERARARATGKRFRITLGIRIKKIFSSQ